MHNKSATSGATGQGINGLPKVQEGYCDPRSAVTLAPAGLLAAMSGSAELGSPAEANSSTSRQTSCCSCGSQAYSESDCALQRNLSNVVEMDK
ncbi:MAG: hypothetical protein FRX49_03261 [Trebouxia sp. A1-2]|nr:MAG: hypothetical protein FRX49_03261 [Trebouxia sp. A1-2]